MPRLEVRENIRYQALVILDDQYSLGHMSSRQADCHFNRAPCQRGESFGGAFFAATETSPTLVARGAPRSNFRVGRLLLRASID